MSGASMNDIKNRIKSVDGTMQITKAMELVATSKLRRAKEAAERAKPYMKLLSDAITVFGSIETEAPSPYIEERDGKTLYIVIAGDRGLAGGYNNNVFKLVSTLDTDKSGVYLPIGKKAVDYYTRRGVSVLSREWNVADDVSAGDAMRLAALVASAYVAGEFTSVKLIYTKFISMLTQQPTYDRILPLLPEKSSTAAPIVECDAEEMLKTVVVQYVGGMVYAAVREAIASECGARRCAMNSANKNAEEMITDLRLKYNRARQAVITQEITEIVSGAEAL